MNKALRRIYEEELANAPFPTDEYRSADIDDEAHGILIVYLADIAGLASRGERLSKSSESDKTKFRRTASQSLFERCPRLSGKISPAATPSLNALVQATERARLLILQALVE